MGQKLEEETTPINGTESEAPVEIAQTSAPEVDASPAVDPETASKELAEEDAKQAEKPADPSPTPAAKPAPQAAEPAPVEPAAPPKPMTWASRAAAAAGPRPVVPLPKTATPPATNQSRAPAPAPVAAPAAAPAQTSAPAPAAEAPVKEKETTAWQTAGVDPKRQGRPQSISGNVAEKEGTMGYVKYVTEKVQEADLRSALAAHGELAYFDINRSKVCTQL